MTFYWLLLAFIFGFIAQGLKLPPLLGYLIAGFFLNAMGLKDPSGLVTLEALSNFGISVLLFTIGLKLNIKSLLKREVFVTATGHMTVFTLVAALVVLAIYSLQWIPVSELSIQQIFIIAFAFSFSSTVVVAKLLEERGEMRTRHGQIAIGVLIIQDLVAVIFLSLTTQKLPSVYAIALFLLPLLRPLIVRVLQIAGHGELMILSGFLLALSGNILFEALGLKGDLGSLIFGLIISGDKKADELSKSLLVFKDLFLIAFFLLIGLNELPNFSVLLMAFVLCCLLPIKQTLFFFLLTAMRIRTRAAFLCSMSLNNFSEFGLIVVALAASAGWLPTQWVLVIALAMSFSFVVSGFVNLRTHALFGQLKHFLHRFERGEPLPEDVLVQPSGAKILIVGMGRLGTHAYEFLKREYGQQVCGVDASSNRVVRHQSHGRRVILGDAEDEDFWEQVDLQHIDLILLALPTLEDVVVTNEQLRRLRYHGKVTTTAKYQDEINILLDAGVHIVFNFYAEAGKGFASESQRLIIGKGDSENANEQPVT